MNNTKPDKDADREVEQLPDHRQVSSGTRKPWRDPGQEAQDPTQRPNTKHDLERWQRSKTH